MNKTNQTMSNQENNSIHDFDFSLICEYFSLIKRQGPGSETCEDGFFLVRPAWVYSNGCKFLTQPNSGKRTAKDKGVHRKVKSEIFRKMLEN